MGKWLSPNTAGNGILWVVAVAITIGGWINQVIAIGLLILAFLWTIASIAYWHITKRNYDELEVRITPSKYVDSSKPNPFYGIEPGQSLGAFFGLTLINHNTTKGKRIETANLSLKKRVLLGNKTLFSVPVEYLAQPENRILRELTLNPQEKFDVTVSVYEHIPVITRFPRKSKLMLILKMIGFPRKIEYELDNFKHDPKLVPDIPDWKKQ